MARITPEPKNLSPRSVSHLPSPDGDVLRELKDDSRDDASKPTDTAGDDGEQGPKEGSYENDEDCTNLRPKVSQP